MNASQNRLQEIETALSRPGAWDKPDELTPMLREKGRLEDKVRRFTRLRDSGRDTREWLEMAKDDQGNEVLEALAEQLKDLEETLAETELAVLLSGPEDKSAAIVAIHPGAGGVDAQDWAEILLRMYVRFSERKEFKVSELDMLPGEEAGIKSVTIQVDGPYAYGMLKAEAGIHRLVRISPFDSSGRRHTAFASVDVWPDAEEDIDIEVRDEDLRVDVFRASGPGGQHVNKTNSAVRITHLPSGIVVQCQNEKSQFKNKDHAMKILKARLLEAEIKARDETRQEKYASKEAIAWGSQIRSYVMQPYRLVKDHRTGTETGNVEAVLDGAIDEFIRSYQLHVHESEQRSQ